MPPKAPPQSSHGRRRLHLFVTGQPGCGKTTLIARVCDRLRAAGVAPQGFYTEEVRSKGGERTGFDIVTLDGGQRGPLSRVGKAKAAGAPMVGSFVVDLPSFEALALPSLALDTTTTTTKGAASNVGKKRPRSSGGTAGADEAKEDEEQGGAGAASGNNPPQQPPSPLRVVVIDEVGKMELFSARFKARVSALLDDPRVLVLGSVPMPRYGREIEFVGGIKYVRTYMVWLVVHSFPLCRPAPAPAPYPSLHVCDCVRTHTHQHMHPYTHMQCTQIPRARADVALVKVLKGTREEAYREALSHVLAALGLPSSSS